LAAALLLTVLRRAFFLFFLDEDDDEDESSSSGADAAADAARFFVSPLSAVSSWTLLSCMLLECQSSSLLCVDGRLCFRFLSLFCVCLERVSYERATLAGVGRTFIRVVVTSELVLFASPSSLLIMMLYLQRHQKKRIKGVFVPVSGIQQPPMDTH
jgi:hypothetical protein